jgi:hypothetical protein
MLVNKKKKKPREKASCNTCIKTGVENISKCHHCTSFISSSPPIILQNKNSISIKREREKKKRLNKK